MAGGFKNFVAGAVLLESDLDSYLMRQTVMVFASASARDSALSGVLVEGMHAYLSDKNWLTYYDGSAWVIRTGRIGVSLTAATASINSASLTSITFTTENLDTDGFISVSSSTITIPTGLGGIYAISARCGLTSACSGAVEIVAGGKTFDFSFASPVLSPGAAIGAIDLAAAQTVGLAIYQALGSAQNVSADLWMFRTGPST
jgi:hypothetical protein